MPRNRNLDETVAPGCRGADLLGALPDAILKHVLSFLPSRDAVRTCLLARSWRHQWKSAPALRITGVDSFRSAGHLNDFVNYLIVLRDRTPLHACEIETYKHDEDDSSEGSQDNDDDKERSRYTDLWIRYALSCHVRLLRLSDHDPDNLDPKHHHVGNVWLETPISSQHLTTFDLDGVIFSSKYSLDFSSCPNLETVKMHRCSFEILGFRCDGPIKISSLSVRYLSITDCAFGDKVAALITVRNLVYLELASGRGKVPRFGCTPSLLEASIKLDDEDGSLLLGRLSNTTNLELMAKPQASAAFRKDLKRCTTFSKLKTLSLNDWCVEPDLGPLLYILQRSPSLEKLCLRLSKSYQHAEERDKSYDSTVPFLALNNLRDIEIKCQAKDERVYTILKVLSSYGVPVEQINIRKKIGLPTDHVQIQSSQTIQIQNQSTLSSQTIRI